jgi:signal transduction histidine kinase
VSALAANPRSPSLSPGRGHGEGQPGQILGESQSAQPPPAPADIEILMRAMDATARRLDETHAALQREVVRLQEELAEANAQLGRSRSLAALGEMAAGIAHEIRNPLASIRLYVQMLEGDLAHAPAQRDLCRKIGRAVIDIDCIVRDVLQLARHKEVRLASIDVREAVDQAIEQCAGLVASANAAVHVEVEDESAVHVVGDAGLLAQAIGNLVRNGVEAASEAGRSPEVTIGVRAGRVRAPHGGRAQRVIVAVDDNGPGIPRAVVERMFNPFFTTRPRGTGLGLAIVHRIVDVHGGHVRVDRAPGGGARLELCLLPGACDGPSSAIAAIPASSRSEPQPEDPA